jgi:hypothetical protein
MIYRLFDNFYKKKVKKSSQEVDYLIFLNKKVSFFWKKLSWGKYFHEIL